MSLFLGGLFAFPHHHTGATLVHNVAVLTAREEETVNDEEGNTTPVST